MVLISKQVPVPVIADGKLDPGVMRAVRDLQADLGRVGGTRGRLLDKVPGRAPAAIIVGTLGSSTIIDRLVREHRLDASGVAGRWEAYLQQVVEDPTPGIERALVIAGADKRGTIFGAYDLSRQLPVAGDVGEVLL